MRTRMKSGFTLVEILIVVVILGILAAIVIPQFSQASTDAKVNSLKSDLQTLRSQIALYKIQHNDTPPASVALFEAAMTKCSAATAAADADYVVRTADNKVTHPYGPYLQAVPANPFSDKSIVASGTGGWLYDAVTGSITAADGLSTNGTAHSTY